MDFNEVHSGIQKNRKRKRIGRGSGSGHGKTSGRGHKGAKSRAGYSRNPIFEGGRMPIVRRVPKRGFFNKFAVNVVAINIADLEREFAAGDEVTPDTLRAKGLAKRRYDELKVLGDGDLTKKLTVSAHRFSASAKEKIEGAGGSCVIIPGKTPVEEKKKAAREAKK
ncbi:50S ribosomal protein L15 [Blastopirellula retiformator]|uniref:Large ribosomal subunit protein uL15 n=1 Tax=Blastopirellula retiformator TaxID=2527970 RepID=A0A5C5V5Y1_9BACT|nr:50S ribosomal protein L15 [Blastopirellula retiformator]TWT33162.1 50S ribosomal protein L15 [Blastopirellula retiformator]